ncbi:putative membrane protein [Aminobacter sp. J15]|nr:putative membrane protein [Aminobacter sp. J15]
MMPPRKPAAFKVTPIESETKDAERHNRAPRALSPELVTPVEIDVFDEEEQALTVPPPPVARRRSKLGGIFFAAIGILISLALGLWVDSLIRDLFSRSDWLGWFAAAVAAIAALAFIVILARELVGLARLASVEKLRAGGLDAIASNDARRARVFVQELSGFVSRRPETAAVPCRTSRARSLTAPIWSVSPRRSCLPRSTRAPRNLFSMRPNAYRW